MSRAVMNTSRSSRSSHSDESRMESESFTNAMSGVTSRCHAVTA